MTKRFCLLLSAAVVVSVVVQAQTDPVPASPIVASWHAKFSKGWTPPKTPWGDPDLQGNYTTVDEIRKPMERPKEFEGRTLDSITPAQMDEINRKGHELSAVNSYSGGVPTHWYEVEYQKNSTAWGVLDPPDGKIPPVKPEGAAISKKLRAAMGTSRSEAGGDPSTYLDWSLWDRCISRDVPPLQMIPTAYGNSYRILQTPDYVAIQYEMVHETRIIPIKGRKADRPRLAAHLVSYMGDSIGWFEGNTFVVDAIFPEKAELIHGAPPATTRVIERFTRRTAPNGVEYTATVINPTYWARPWTWQQRLTEDDRQVIFEYACHEDNHAMVNSLAGTRDKERREAERAKRVAEREKAEAAKKGTPAR